MQLVAVLAQVLPAGKNDFLFAHGAFQCEPNDSFPVSPCVGVFAFDAGLVEHVLFCFGDAPLPVAIPGFRYRAFGELK